MSFRGNRKSKREVWFPQGKAGIGVGIVESVFKGVVKVNEVASGKVTGDDHFSGKYAVKKEKREGKEDEYGK